MISKKFKILRGILSALGLSQDSSDDVIEWIGDLIAKDKHTPVSTRLTAQSSPSKLYLPYAKRSEFLSPAELNFYRVLAHVIQNQALIFTKVKLSDLFCVTSKNRSEFQTFLNKIDRKHIDFLICDNELIQPLCGIELDDKSHKRPDRKERDRFVNAVFEISALPLVHIPVSSSYNTSKLSDLLSSHLHLDDNSKTNASKLTTGTNPLEIKPTCYKCGNEMVLRTAKRGNNAGNHFWGCTNYPHCRAILKVETNT